MSHNLILQEGAILIADAHYSPQYPQFYDFLQALDKGEIKTPQLILMGDMFELLFGVIKQTLVDNAKEVELLNVLSEKMEIIYFEGNHDFGIKKVFPNIRVFSLDEQPQLFDFEDETIQLSHGDTKTPLGYQLYTHLIRNPFILGIVGFVDILCSHCIIKWLKSRGEQKEPCYKIKNFKEIINRRLNYLKDKKIDCVIEGHFHQDTQFDICQFRYINLSSFACKRKYFIVQSKNKQLYLHETRFKES